MNKHKSERDGIRYFLYLITLGKEIQYMTDEIRFLIWKYAHPLPYFSCNICDAVLLKINLHGAIINNTKNYQIINGMGACNNCYTYL